MIDRDIQRIVKAEAAALQPKINADALFTSREFYEHLKNLIDTTTERYKMKIKLLLQHDESSDMTACTDGREIYQNTHSELVYRYKNLFNRYMACVGMTMHEVAHILFCNFDEDRKAVATMEQGTFYGEEPDAETQEETAALIELKDAMQQPEFRPVFVQIYNTLSNFFDDPHDEDKLIDKFGGFVGDTILIIREALRLCIVPLEEMMADKNMSKLSVIYSAILQWARFGEVVANDPDKIFELEPMRKLASMSVALDTARFTDDPVVKAGQMNKILLYLWPYIKEEIEKQEQSSQSSQNGQNQSSGNGTGQQQSSEGTSQTQSQSSTPTPSGQTIQSILNQLNHGARNSGQTVAPKDVKTSAEAKKATKRARKGQQPQTQAQIQKGQGAVAALGQTGENAVAQTVLDTLVARISEAMAEETVQQDLSRKIGAEIETVSQNSTHSGRKITVVHQTDVSEADKQRYDDMMKELVGYSKRLQKQMADALHDLKNGSIAHHRAFGNRFEANSAYRPDQRYFAKQKLPQDLPGMAISILVDHSGSMSGERLLSSMKASMLLYDFATKLDIPVCVAGHNTLSDGIRYYTYTDYRQVSANEKYRLAKMVCGSCNRDGMALEISANQLAKRPEEIKLLIIISDGQPNDTGYGGEEAANDLRSIVQKYRKQGIETIAAAIGSDKDRIKEIYGEGAYLDIDDLDRFPKTLVGLVKKKILP